MSEEKKELHIDGEELSMADMLANAEQEKVQRDTIVEAKVVAVTKEEVTVDIGLKSEGFIPIAEFEEDGVINVKVGDSINVLLLRKENAQGMPEVSYQKARSVIVQKELLKKFNEKEPVVATIKTIVRGGYTVSIGIPAFMPLSQAPHYAKKEDALGKVCTVLMIKFERNNIVVSARAYQDVKRAEAKKSLLEHITVGARMHGVVRNLTNYGAFVDVGGMDGLLHVSDMSWSRLEKPSALLHKGQDIEVIILAFDPEKEKISLGLKQLSQDPWESIEFKIKPGSIVTGRVTRLIKVGAVVDVMPGIEGFIHIEDMSWTKKIRRTEDVLTLGDTVKVKVLGIDKERRQINLGLKQIEQNPWEKVKARYVPDSLIHGVVTSLTDFGAFVKLEEGVDGMIHVSDMSWKSSIQHPKECLHVGDVIEAVVLRINVEEQKISLGLKQKENDPFKKYNAGQNHKGVITRVTDRNIMIKLDDGTMGIIPAAQANVPKETNLETVFKVGDEIIAKIIKVDNDRRDLVFSIRSYEREKEQQDIENYLGSNEFSPTLGDLLSRKVKEKLKEENT